MKKLLFIIIIFGFALSSCEKTTKVVVKELTVASQKYVVTVDGETYERFWVKEQGDDDWSLIPTNIKNFDYTQGYEYVMVLETVYFSSNMADASGARYTMLDLISEIQKDSEGLPE